MLTGIDHVILAVPDLDAAAAHVRRALRLRVAPGGRHDAHGTHNRIVWLGDAYVELMAVFDPALAAGSWWGRRALDVLARGGGLVGVALATDDAAAESARLRAHGSPVSEPVAGQRARPDGELVRWWLVELPHAHPELGLVFLIEHDLNAAEWRPADRQARAAEAHPLGTPARLLRLEVSVADVRRTTQQLLRELGLQFRPALAGGGARDTSIGRQVLRLRSSAGAPLIAIHGGAEEREVDLLGCRWQLVPADA